ncbi:MAG: aminotransferase class IV [Betaproteobacteria bacterium]|nr:aminotransferase class IV [Betaproteobacteria bacterium]
MNPAELAIAGSEVYVNGSWQPRNEASISVFDRGFLFGDGVYEVITAYGRQPFLLEEHLARLESSLAEIRIANPRSNQQWRQLIGDAIGRQDFPDQKIYLQVTRGAAFRVHRFPENPQPAVVLFVDPFTVPDQQHMAAGIKTVTLTDFRWQRGDIKATSLLAAVLGSQAAADAGADETIWIRDGNVCEGASSNLLAVIDGQLCSPAPACTLLRGVTLDHGIRIAEEAGIAVERRNIAAAELDAASEVMVSSATREITAVTSIDGKTVGDGVAGPMQQRLHALYRAKTDALHAAAA